MNYNQLKEMPRFWVQYVIKFFNDKDKTQILEIINEKMIHNDDFIFECLYEEEDSFSIYLSFKDFLFCGFSSSDAIIYLFPEEILARYEKIIAKYSKTIKDISLSVECCDNIFATRYYMYTNIIGKAAEIVHKLRPNIYFDVGKDGIGRIKTLRETCMKVCGINIDDYKDLKSLKKQIQLEIKRFMINKKENFKEIILLRYALKFVKELIAKKITKLN